MRRIVANLDFEEELRAAERPETPYRPLSHAACRVAARAGARLAGLAAPGDRLWLPSAAPGDLPAGTDGRGPELETGLLEELPPADQVLAWGEGPRVAALRSRWRSRSPTDPAAPLDGPVDEVLWRLPPPEPAVVVRVAHRGFAFALARERGWSLPGSAMVRDPQEIERAISAWTASRSSGPRDVRDLHGGAWVAKAPYSAAGRERVFGAGAAAVAGAAIRRRVDRLLEAHGCLLLEPWVERTADFGCAGLVTAAGVRRLTLHAQTLDARGVFRETVPLPSDFVPLPAAERAAIEEAFEAAGDRLGAAGYSGAFGIDAFRWRTAGGRERLQPLVEINPRLTFGLVARVAAGARAA